MAGQTITNYATLEQSLQDWLARSDITDSNYLPEIIQMGEERIYNGFTDNKGNYFPGLRVRQMEKAFGSGMVSAITIAAGGSAYAAADTIAFTAAPAGGVTATGTLTLTAGVITGVTVTNPGLGYTATPTVTITTSTGTGGSITATIITNSIEIGPSPNAVYAVPSDYLDLKYMILQSSGISTRMLRKTAEWIYQYYPDRSADNMPQYVARDGSVFIFAPYPDSQYSLSGYYYSKAAYLSSSNTSNFLTDNYPSLLFAACMAELCTFIRDAEGLQYWEGKYQERARTVQTASDRENYSGSPMTMAPG